MKWAALFSSLLCFLSGLGLSGSAASMMFGASGVLLLIAIYFFYSDSRPPSL